MIGCSGAGKSTLATAIAREAGIPCLELDAIHHLPGWTVRPLDEFRDDVARFVAGDAWVVDGNYSKARDLVWGRADTVLFVDLPRATVMRQLVRRSVGRILRRTELWNGNRESLRGLLSLGPEDNILLWSWKRHPINRRRFDDARGDPRWAHVEFVRFRTHAQAERWLASRFSAAARPGSDEER